MFEKIVIVFSVLAVIAAVGAEKYTHAEALEKIQAAGIVIASSGGCSNRNSASCTSLEQIRRKTIDSGVLVLKEASNCAITITGGTEVGHASASTYSHSNGYKLDYRVNTCLNDYITDHYSYVGVRGDGAKQYRSAAGNMHSKETIGMSLIIEKLNLERINSMTTVFCLCINFACLLPLSA